MGMSLVYVYLEDPCNRKLRADFSNKYPSYKILISGPGEGDSDGAGFLAGGENVYCHIQYQKPDSEQIYEDIWLYRELGGDWNFSEIRSGPVN
jgi:hypothetical protein